MKIKIVKPKQISDSRGNPTVEVELETGPDHGCPGKFSASVPSGASKGKYEALELRDKDGKGVKKALSNIKKIITPAIKDKEFNTQQEIDDILIKLDGTENKSRLGVNAILPVSIAACRAFAASEKLPLYQYIAKLAENSSLLILPRPCFNFIEGGAHAENDLDFQEFMVVPQKQSFRENFMVASQIFQNLKEILEKNFGETGQGDEGGFAPKINKTEQALLSLKSAIEKNPETKIGLDAAASQFFKEEKYFLENQGLTRAGLLDFYKDLIEEFSIIFIEDPFAQDDWQGWELMMRSRFSPNSEIEDSRFGHKTESEQMGEKVFVIGDDLTTTNIKRIREAHNKNACNGIIIKPNQIGTITETLEAVKLAKEFNWKIMVSHRSGETLDDFIADLAVGVGADFIKAGAPVTPERMAKYNRLLAIEEEINKS